MTYLTHYLTLTLGTLTAGIVTNDFHITATISGLLLVAGVPFWKAWEEIIKGEAK